MLPSNARNTISGCVALLRKNKRLIDPPSSLFLISGEISYPYFAGKVIRGLCSFGVSSINLEDWLSADIRTERQTRLLLYAQYREERGFALRAVCDESCSHGSQGGYTCTICTRQSLTPQRRILFAFFLLKSMPTPLIKKRETS